MNGRDSGHMFDTEQEVDRPDLRPLGRALRERLRSVRNPNERRSLIATARELARIPGETALAAFETTAAIAAVSPRAAIEFFRSAPEASRILNSGALKAWGDLGRRLAMADSETAALFLAEGVGQLADVPQPALTALFALCARQASLATSSALGTIATAHRLASATRDTNLLIRIYETADEIAARSAKQSSDFLSIVPEVMERFREVDQARASEIAEACLEFARILAERGAGLATDFWRRIPHALQGLRFEAAIRLLHAAEEFMERGGGAAAQVFSAGAEAMRWMPDVFDDWIRLAKTVAEGGNASLVALARASPAFFRAMRVLRSDAERAPLTRRIIDAAIPVALVDSESGILCLRSAPAALKVSSPESFENWTREGLLAEFQDQRRRRSYYALETKFSNERLTLEGPGLALEGVAPTLRLYVEGLSGKEVEIVPLGAFTEEARIHNGHTIQLPAMVNSFDEKESNFRLFKVLAALASGQIEFDTRQRGGPDLARAYRIILGIHASGAQAAFSLDGYLAEEESASVHPATLPREGEYGSVLALFPHQGLATRIFSTLENGRIALISSRKYRGLARDLEVIKRRLRETRPRIASLPAAMVPFELLFQITVCGGALPEARAAYGQIVSELEGIFAEYLLGPSPRVADTLLATSKVYSLFQSVVPEMTKEEQAGGLAEEPEPDTSSNEAARQSDNEQNRREPQSTQQDARELFSTWARSEAREGDNEELSGGERWEKSEVAEQDLEPGEVAYLYEEWDRELSDKRVGWCRVVEKRVRRGDRSFVDLARSRYRGTISSIRRQFQMMKPESLLRVKNELDGEDYDLNSVIDYVADRRALGVTIHSQSERLYVKRLRRERDVAVSFLLDQSSSTARTMGRHPLQPYSRPGRRIIEIEKEALVLMSEALEAVGDAYAMYGFTSEGRRNVKFYIIKDFNEHYGPVVESRIGGINYQSNTRLGAAVRHASARLARHEARTRLLIVLSDGRPYDHDYGDARYAREDTREALKQARLQGIVPFCITIDRDSETELRDLYGEVGYTIIDDIQRLPERMPAIYRRLTT